MCDVKIDGDDRGVALGDEMNVGFGMLVDDDVLAVEPVIVAALRGGAGVEFFDPARFSESGRADSFELINRYARGIYVE